MKRHALSNEKKKALGKVIFGWLIISKAGMHMVKDRKKSSTLMDSAASAKVGRVSEWIEFFEENKARKLKVSPLVRAVGCLTQPQCHTQAAHS